MARYSRVLVAFAFACCLTAPVWSQPASIVQDPLGDIHVDSNPSGDAQDLATKAAAIIRYDDGGANTSIKGLSTTFEAAMRFNGVGGSDVTLGAVDVCWRQTGSDSKIRYEVVIWAANGPGGTPGTELANFSAVANGVTNAPAFYHNNLNYALTTSNVYIGVRWNPVVDPSFYLCVDTDGLDGTTVVPAYYRNDEIGSWTSISSFVASYNALMIRAYVYTPGVFAENLILPYFLVDKSDAYGTTTLYAIRNLTDSARSVAVEYFRTDGTSQGGVSYNLGPRETKTINLRDIAGLSIGMDGFARGYVTFTTAGNPDMTPVLAGDFFQVDVGNNFATGNRLVRQIGLCQDASIRFADFPLPNSGSILRIWVSNPRGVGASDPPSFTVRVLDQSGAQVGSLMSVKTTAHALQLPSSTFTGINFGTFVFDFTNSGSGMVYAEYSTQGRFSVGLDSQCADIP